MGFGDKILKANAEHRNKLTVRNAAISRILTEDPAINWGCGGYIRGKTNLFFGPKGSGKSTMALYGAGREWSLIKEAIENEPKKAKDRGWILIFDTEWAYDDPHAMDADGNYTEDAIVSQKRFASAGIPWEKVLLVQENESSAISAHFKDLEEAAENDKLAICCVIYDAWGNVESQTVRDQQDSTDAKKRAKQGSNYGGNSKTIGPMMSRLQRIAGKHGVTQFHVQHCSQNMDEYGDAYNLPGGEKLKHLVHCVMLFYSSESAKARLVMHEGVETVTDTDNAKLKAEYSKLPSIGKKIIFKCYKTRKMVEGRSGYFYMNFENVSFAATNLSMWNLAEKMGIVKLHYAQDLDKQGNPVLDSKGNPKLSKTTKWEFPVGAINPTLMTKRLPQGFARRQRAL